MKRLVLLLAWLCSAPIVRAQSLEPPWLVAPIATSNSASSSESARSSV